MATLTSRATEKSKFGKARIWVGASLQGRIALLARLTTAMLSLACLAARGAVTHGFLCPHDSHRRLAEAARWFTRLLQLIVPRLLMVQSDKITTFFVSGAFVIVGPRNAALLEGLMELEADEAGREVVNEEVLVWKDIATGNFIRDTVSFRP